MYTLLLVWKKGFHSSEDRAKDLSCSPAKSQSLKGLNPAHEETLLLLHPTLLDLSQEIVLKNMGTPNINILGMTQTGDMSISPSPRGKVK